MNIDNLKFALLIDGCVQRSFFVEDGKSYKLKSDKKEPYVYHHSISNECGMGPFAWPFCFNGHFINWTEWDELPDLDLDVIFVSIEKHPDKYKVEQVRKAYPNALVVATLKELYFIPSIQQRIDFFNECDAVVVPHADSIFDMFPELKTKVNKKIHWLPYATDVDYLHNKYYTEERTESIFSYIVPHPPRRGQTEEFAAYIGNKYNIPVVRDQVVYTGPECRQWEEFLEMFSPHTFCFNLDPEPQYGNQAIQSAIFGIVNIGGINDSHGKLFPKTANNDPDLLEREFVKHLDMDYRIEQIQKSFQRVNDLYGFPETRIRYNNIIKEIYG